MLLFLYNRRRSSDSVRAGLPCKKIIVIKFSKEKE